MRQRPETCPHGETSLVSPRKPASRELTRSGSGGAIFSRFREFFRRFTRLVSPSIARGVKVVCQIHLVGFTHAISPDSRSVATKRGSQPTRFARLAPIAVTMRGSQPTRLARLARCCGKSCGMAKNRPRGIRARNLARTRRSQRQRIGTNCSSARRWFESSLGQYGCTLTPCDGKGTACWLPGSVKRDWPLMAGGISSEGSTWQSGV